MSNDLAEKIRSVALDQDVWQAWLAKNRAAEKRLNARMARIALVVAFALTILGLAWLITHF
jgi:hypothetical protein